MTDRFVRQGDPTSLRLYDQTARDAAAAVISAYSTSFGLATRLLGPRPRPHVRSIYALVRVADEIVDGPGAAAGLTEDEVRETLDALESETFRAIARGFSANLIVHAFAGTARECGIGEDLIRPFFSSMRTDITTARHDDSSHDDYVYGSAEVVGLMCLQVFVNAGTDRPAVAASPTLVEGARRLGAAFQDVNFLRDAFHDEGALGRDYLGVHDSASRTVVLDRIDADLAAAAAVVPLLPADCRRAVTAAHDLFAELSARLRAPVEPGVRVRVPDPVKAGLIARALVGRPPRGAKA